MGVSFYVPEVGTAQEVTFSLSGGLGEAPTGGPQMNIVPRAGGNTFSGSLFVTGANGACRETTSHKRSGTLASPGATS